VTCQLTDEGDVIAEEPMRIVNAAKGDLFLSPGSSLGLVGAILGALRPSQHYTHMGIFVDDGLSIRHATFSSERAMGDLELTVSAACGAGGLRDR
jgi:hypothetical protein